MNKLVFVLVLGLVVVSVVNARRGGGGGGGGGAGGGGGGGAGGGGGGGGKGHGKSKGPSRGPSEGGPKDGFGKGHGQGMGGLVCSVTDSLGNTKTRDCANGECTLGPLEYTDTSGNVVRSVLFCDGLDADGTSEIAARACLITDTAGTVLVNNTASFNPRKSWLLNPISCTLELPITYQNVAALAYFPEKTCTRTTTVEDEEDEETSVIVPEP